MSHLFRFLRSFLNNVMRGRRPRWCPKWAWKFAKLVAKLVAEVAEVVRGRRPWWCPTWAWQYAKPVVQVVLVLGVVVLVLVIIYLLHVVSTLAGQIKGIFIPLDPVAAEQHKLCAAHGWKPFQSSSSSSPRKVYDLVMVNTELALLEIRLNTTWDVVDYFVMVEGSRTFTGIDKPLVLKENMAKFNSYQSKIIYHEIEYPANFNPEQTWAREDLQRNAMLEQVFPRLQGAQTPTYGDVIVVADVDEIPRPETLTLLKACLFPRRLTLWSHLYYYSFQYRRRGDWPFPQATYYQGDETVRPNDLRHRLGLGWFLEVGSFLRLGWFLPKSWWDIGELKEAAWHCSWCFRTIDEMLTKMRSFSHRSMNKKKYRDKDWIANRVRTGKDIWEDAWLGRKEQFDRVENNTDVPRFLLENPGKYPYILNRDGPTAGFFDYVVS